MSFSRPVSMELATFLPDVGVVEKWASGHGLGNDVEILAVQLTRTNVLLGAAASKDIANVALSPLLVKLQQLVYDAEGIVDELDYFRLQEMIEGGISNPTDLAIRSSDVAVPVSEFRDNSVAAEAMPALDKRGISCRIKQVVGQLREVGDVVRKGLKLENLDSALQAPWSARKERTSSFCAEPTKVFGRDRERDRIVELLRSDEVAGRSLSVVSIVGNGGIGKTTLAQLVYHDSRVQDCFQLQMWICVSVSFDEVRLTKEMLEHADGVKEHEGITNLNRLQEILAKNLRSKRFLLVLDDIWQIETDSRWQRLLAPLKHSPVKGKLILATTRNRSIANMIGTMEPIDLGVLDEEQFWKCFRAYAFGDEKYEGHDDMQPILSKRNKHLLPIGKEIATKLKGYPLAAKSVGALLRRELSVAHWRSVLENKAWKSQQQSDDIIPILRLSYDYLPFHLQRCFSYCSLFPKDQRFDGEDLVCIWISQGFIHHQHDNRRPEEVGSEYLDDLVNFGFFQKLDRTFYLMHDLIHDLAQMVSSNECFTLGVSKSEQLLPATVRHLSIINKSIYHPDEDGIGTLNGSFEKEIDEIFKLLETRNLRSLMVFGGYDSSFRESFQNVFRNLKNVRTLLQAGQSDSRPLFCNLGQFIHLRYIRFTAAPDIPSLEALCRLYHLQVLALGRNYFDDLPRSFRNLVNLRHFFAQSEMHLKIAEVGKLTSLQEVQKFKVQKEVGFEIRQLRSLRELGGSLRIYNLENVESKLKATEAKLKDKRRLTELFFYWNKSSIDARPVIEEEVLEGLQPHPNLNHLTVDGYAGATSPTWLGDSPSLVSLQSLCLEDCNAWRTTFPSFAHFPHLKKLRLVRIPGVSNFSTASSLEEMVIEDVTELESWVVTDKDQLAYSLQVLEISNCPKLKELPFSHCSSFGVESNHWFPHLHMLTIKYCAQLKPLPPLPLGPEVSKMFIKNVGSSSYESLSLRFLKLLLKGSAELKSLNESVLVFQNLRALEELCIITCSNLTYLSWEGFRQLTSLKKLSIKECPNLLSIMPTTQEEQDDGKGILLPSLESLEISSCGIRGKYISLLLVHQPPISYLKLEDCPGIASLEPDQQEDEGRSRQPSDGPEIASPLLTVEGLVCIPSGSLKSLQALRIANCPDLVCANKQGLRGLASLKELEISGCPKLLCYDASLEKEEEHQNSNNSSLLPSSLQKVHITGVSRCALMCSIGED